MDAAAALPSTGLPVVDVEIRKSLLLNAYQLTEPGKTAGEQLLQRMFAPRVMPQPGTTLVDMVVQEIRRAGATAPSLTEVRPELVYETPGGGGAGRVRKRMRLVGFSVPDQKAVLARVQAIGAAPTQARRAGGARRRGR